MKICTKCLKEQPLTNFCERVGGTGRQSHCHSCKASWKREHGKPSPYKYNHKGLTKYWPNLTPSGARAAYTALLNSQGGVCAICDRAPNRKKLSVDHCHLSGRVRGLLCDHCNLALGLFKDNVQLLQMAQGYLEY